MLPRVERWVILATRFARERRRETAHAGDASDLSQTAAHVDQSFGAVDTCHGSVRVTARTYNPRDYAGDAGEGSTGCVSAPNRRWGRVRSGALEVRKNGGSSPQPRPGLITTSRSRRAGFLRLRRAPSRPRVVADAMVGDPRRIGSPTIEDSPRQNPAHSGSSGLVSNVSDTVPAMSAVTGVVSSVSVMLV